uniref:hypothetical protein n=1 Tax=uncultured Bilophila sp. TaxID=529385 RepID=UPI0025E5BD56|nr:hypothetical protein [uncultured Bilophila sp.]
MGAHYARTVGGNESVRHKKTPSRFAWRIAASLDKKGGKTLNSFPQKPIKTLNTLELLAVHNIFPVVMAFLSVGGKKNPEHFVFIRVQGFQ